MLFIPFHVYAEGFRFRVEGFIQHKHGYGCCVCACAPVFPRGVGLPVVRVFLPVGQSVESHPGHQRDPHGGRTRHCGLLLLLHRHLGERLTSIVITGTVLLTESLELRENSSRRGGFSLSMQTSKIA